MKLILTLITVFSSTAVLAQPMGCQWAHSVGGNQIDAGLAVCSDGNGNFIATGSFASATIAFGNIVLTNPNPGSDALFIVKYDPSGNAIWAKSNANADGRAITTDATGNIYVAGSFYGTLHLDAASVTSGGYTDVFICKMDGNGNVIWLHSAGGPYYDGCSGVAVDGTGNLFIVGNFESTTFTCGSTTLTNTGLNLFIAKLSSSGTFQWAHNAGSSDPYCEARSVVADNAGNAIITGSFNNPTITLGSYTLSNTASENFFAAKYDPSGNTIWARCGGIGSDYGAYAVATDATGNVYIAGWAVGFAFVVDTLSYNAAYNGTFVLKLNAGGDPLWVSVTNSDYGGSLLSICVDNFGSIWASGYFDSTLIFGNTTLHSAGASDGCLLHYNSNGLLLEGRSFGSAGNDYFYGVTTDPNRNVCCVGSFVGPTIMFDGITLTDSTSMSASDFVIAKFGRDLSTSDLDNNSFVVYPNPSAGAVLLRSETSMIGQVHVIDVRGRVIFDKFLGQQLEEINTQEWPAGIYMIKCGNQGRVFVKE